MVETGMVCVSVLGGFSLWLWWMERREERRFAHRADMAKLRAAAVRAEDVEKLSQRVQRLENKGLVR